MAPLLNYGLAEPMTSQGYSINHCDLRKITSIAQNVKDQESIQGPITQQVRKLRSQPISHRVHDSLLSVLTFDKRVILIETSSAKILLTTIGADHNLVYTYGKQLPLNSQEQQQQYHRSTGVTTTVCESFYIASASVCRTPAATPVVNSYDRNPIGKHPLFVSLRSPNARAR